MSDYDSDALAGFDGFFARILDGLAPGKRRRANMKLGQALRRSNTQRIKDNVEPDGSQMEERKPRLDRRGRLRKKSGGKMFRKLRYARGFRVDARPDSVEIGFKSRSAERIAAEHHFGKKGTIGRDASGKKIRHKYAERRLLGFGPSDHQEAMEIGEEMLNLDAPVRR